MTVRMPSTKDVERAERAVAALVERIAAWEAERAAVQAEADDLESRVGALLLDDPAAGGEAVEHVARLRSRVSAAGAAVAEATRRLDQARRDVLRARGAHVRARVVRLVRAADRRQAETDRLLGLLAAHEGCGWVDEATARMVARPDPGGRAVQHGFRVPWTRMIRLLADQLGEHATQLEGLAESGSVDQVVAMCDSPVWRPGHWPLELRVRDDGAVEAEPEPAERAEPVPATT